MQTDPLCRMQIDPERAAARVEYKGTTYYFCTPSCHRAFVANPEKYARACRAPRGGARGEERGGRALRGRPSGSGELDQSR